MEESRGAASLIALATDALNADVTSIARERKTCRPIRHGCYATIVRKRNRVRSIKNQMEEIKMKDTIKLVLEQMESVNNVYQTAAREAKRAVIEDIRYTIQSGRIKGSSPWFIIESVEKYLDITLQEFE